MFSVKLGRKAVISSCSVSLWAIGLRATEEIEFSDSPATPHWELVALVVDGYLGPPLRLAKTRVTSPAGRGRREDPSVPPEADL